MNAVVTIWAKRAMLDMARGDEYFDMINPITKAELNGLLAVYLRSGQKEGIGKGFYSSFTDGGAGAGQARGAGEGWARRARWTWRIRPARRGMIGRLIGRTLGTQQWRSISAAEAYKTGHCGLSDMEGEIEK